MVLFGWSGFGKFILFVLIEGVLKLGLGFVMLNGVEIVLLKD